jgi:hypothetical protein
MLCAVAPLVTGGCTSLATVRSAKVTPGFSASVQVSKSTKPGDTVGWFFHDCARCDINIVAADVGVTHGWWRGPDAYPFAIGVGITGIYPYVDGYLQLDDDRTPAGVGMRVAFIPRWVQSQVHGRFDIPLTDHTRLLLNPGVFLQTGTSPNHKNPGTFLAFVQGIGLLMDGEHISLTPAIAIVAASGQHEGESGSKVFGMASVAVTVHRSLLPR